MITFQHTLYHATVHSTLGMHDFHTCLIWSYPQLTTLGKWSAKSVMVDDCAAEVADIEVQYLIWSDTSELKV